MPKATPEPLHVFGDWTVQPDGTLRNARRRIEIYPDRLDDPRLIVTLHATRIASFDWNNFMPAYLHALAVTGRKQVTFDIDFD